MSIANYEYNENIPEQNHPHLYIVPDIEPETIESDVSLETFTRLVQLGSTANKFRSVIQRTTADGNIVMQSACVPGGRTKQGGLNYWGRPIE